MKKMPDISCLEFYRFFIRLITTGICYMITPDNPVPVSPCPQLCPMMTQVVHQAVGHHEAEPSAARQPVQELFRGAGLPGRNTGGDIVHFHHPPRHPLPLYFAKYMGRDRQNFQLYLLKHNSCFFDLLCP